MKKIDLILALVTGEGIALLFMWFLKKSGKELGFLSFALAIIFPVLALIGIWLADLIGRKFLFVYQFAKFILIGVLFALFDLVVLNSLLIYFGITAGVKYDIFVAISFIIATIIKYAADKFWAFEKSEKEKMGTEFWSFFIVTLISGGIQVLIASLVVNNIGIHFGLTPLLWANVGKLSGIAVASIWNFLGYKFVVFKK